MARQYHDQIKGKDSVTSEDRREDAQLYGARRNAMMLLFYGLRNEWAIKQICNIAEIGRASCRETVYI